MTSKETQEQLIERLRKERDAYANALNLSNTAFMDKVKEFSILKRLAETITWSHDKRQVCLEIVNVIIDETNAENCSLWLSDPDGEHIYLTVAKGQADLEARFFLTESGLARKMKVGDGAAGWVAKHGESLLIEDVSQSPYFSPSSSGKTPDIQSLLCLPVMADKSVLGVLNLSHPDIGAFSRENERVLRLITDQTGIVLTNLNLLEEVHAFNRRLETKVEERTIDLQESQARYHRAVNAGQVGVWDWRIGSWEMYLAPNLKAMLGYDADEGPNDLKGFLKITHPHDRKRFLRKITAHVRGKAPFYEEEHRICHRDGRVLWFLVRAAMEPGGDEHAAIAGSCTNITKRKMAEIQLNKAQEEALVDAHARGRAEFADTVLHNVGNVLNSVNVNATEMRNGVQRMGFEQLLLALDLLIEHRNDLDTYLKNDARGSQLPEYLTRKGEILKREMESLMEMADDLTTKVDLMRDIIETQQSHAREAEIVHLEDPVKLLEESLKVEGERIRQNGVTVHREFCSAKPLAAPWARLVHVLINLIKNAIEAMSETPVEQRFLHAGVELDERLNTVIFIKDTGCGIAPEHMSKMFSRGFTTREEGHGFGLHYCAQAVREMGGQIEVSSDGVGAGARFSLIFGPEMHDPDFTPRKVADA